MKRSAFRRLANKFGRRQAQRFRRQRCCRGFQGVVRLDASAANPSLWIGLHCARGYLIVEKGAAGDAPHGADRDFPVVVATMPINAWQRNAALGVVIALFVGAIIEAPFAHIQLARVDAFIPVLQTTICIADLITAILLFGQYSVQPRLAVLVLASGYIAGGLFAFLQTLAFPGAYAPGGLIGDGIDSPAWLFVWWHTIFPLAVLIYALSKDVPSRPDRSTAITIATTVGCTLAVIGGLALLATAGVAYLPALYTGGVMQQTVFANHINLFMWSWGAIALVVLFVRRRTILDLWLIVTLFAWMPNFVIAATITAVRFSVGWYTARGYALIASCTVLAVLLTETTVLYARIANALVLLRRERSNRLMSLDAATAAMAHEIRQPLTGIGASASAGLNWLNRTPPDFAEVRICLASIVAQKDRASKIIASVRDLFRKQGADHRVSLSVDDVARQVLSLAQHDLTASAVSVSTEFANNLPAVHADRTQLQQVTLNLVRNAVEAMGHAPPHARRLRLATSRGEDSSVVLCVQDSGPGIPAENTERVFEPFFTTKPSGMGLGLAICRTIIEEHGGNLQLVKTDPHGCVFEIALPAAEA
jgi:signal transduction histidine kinase